MKLHRNRFFVVSAILFYLSVMASYADSELALPGVFSDHMVLQRETPISIWGDASPGRKVVVSFVGKEKSTQAGDNGRWEVTLDEVDAGGPFTLSVSDGETSVDYTGVLVGEVWLGSGQSNMEWAVDGHPKNPNTECDEATMQLVGDGDYPQIRISAITRDHLNTPNGGWVPMSAEIRPLLPALMSCVAIRLQKDLDVPIGIVVRCISSSPSGAWLDREIMDADSNIAAQLTHYREKGYPDLLKQHQAALENGDKSKAPARPGHELQPWFRHDIDSRGTHYRKLIAPIAPYTIRGIVWDQGEGGTGVAGVDQFEIMRALVGSWRQIWRQDELPFLYVRKNQYPSDFKEHMDAISTTMVDNHGLNQSLHPPDKDDYAKRIVASMIKHVYARRQN